MTLVTKKDPKEREFLHIIYGPPQPGRFFRESYIFNGRWVKNRLAQILLELFGCFLTLIAILTLPIWGPLDRILKFFHRKGFRDVDGYTFSLSAKAFQKINGSELTSTNNFN